LWVKNIGLGAPEVELFFKFHFIVKNDLACYDIIIVALFYVLLLLSKAQRTHSHRDLNPARMCKHSNRGSDEAVNSSKLIYGFIIRVSCIL